MSLVFILLQIHLKLLLGLVIYGFVENFKRYLLIIKRALITEKQRRNLKNTERSIFPGTSVRIFSRIYNRNHVKEIVHYKIRHSASLQFCNCCSQCTRILFIDKNDTYIKNKLTCWFWSS